MKTLVRLSWLLCAVSLLAACAQATVSPQANPPPLPTGIPQATATQAPSSTPLATATQVATDAPQAATPTPTASAAVPPERIAQAQAIADQFLEGDFAAVEATFDATMASALPADKLKEVRQGLEAQVGAFARQAGARAEKYQQYDVVYVTLEFALAAIDMKIVFDPAGQVAGLFFQPTQSAPPAAYVPPAYVRAETFREQDVTVGGGKWALSGTLTLPLSDGLTPAVVLVHGSGPNDRDETIGPNKPFRDLAWGLASRGIAVLRYEKRTRQHPAQFTADVLATLTLKEETVDDALAAVALLRQTAGIDPARVYVLGHSLGGYAIPRIGLADPQIAGLIVLAGPTRPLEEITLEQVTYIAGLDGTVTADEQASLDALGAQAARVQDPNLSAASPAADLPLGIPANYWLDLRGYDPGEVARGLSQPLLILQGGRDYQVTTVDFEGWKAALASRSDVEFRLYPDLNHLFMVGEGKATPAEYDRAGHVAEPVIADLAQWIEAGR